MIYATMGKRFCVDDDHMLGAGVQVSVPNPMWSRSVARASPPAAAPTPRVPYVRLSMVVPFTYSPSTALPMHNKPGPQGRLWDTTGHVVPMGHTISSWAMYSPCAICVHNNMIKGTEVS